MSVPTPTRQSVAAELREAARVSTKRDASYYRHLSAALICTRVSVGDMLAIAAPTEYARANAAARLRTLAQPEAAN